MVSMSAPCPICAFATAASWATVDNLTYYSCPQCQAIFLTPSDHPNLATEHAHYRLHDNRVDDPDYRQFLTRLTTPLLEKLTAPQAGLDFGCGPGPALATMLSEAGHNMSVYDPLFFADAAVLEQTYDFITATEVIEHLHRPAAVFAQLFAMLRPGGWLAVMTSFPPDLAQFEKWHYRRDPTHVIFYRPATLSWIAAHHNADCDSPAANVALLRKWPS